MTGAIHPAICNPWDAQLTRRPGPGAHCWTGVHQATLNPCALHLACARLAPNAQAQPAQLDDSALWPSIFEPHTGLDRRTSLDRRSSDHEQPLRTAPPIALGFGPLSPLATHMPSCPKQSLCLPSRPHASFMCRPGQAHLAGQALVRPRTAPAHCPSHSTRLRSSQPPGNAHAELCAATTHVRAGACGQPPHRAQHVWPVGQTLLWADGPHELWCAPACSLLHALSRPQARISQQQWPMQQQQQQCAHTQATADQLYCDLLHQHADAWLASCAAHLQPEPCISLSACAAGSRSQADLQLANCGPAVRSLQNDVKRFELRVRSSALPLLAPAPGPRAVGLTPASSGVLLWSRHTVCSRCPVLSDGRCKAVAPCLPVHGA